MFAHRPQGYPAGPDGTMSEMLDYWTGQSSPGSTVGQQALQQYTSGIMYDSRNSLGLPTYVGVPAPPPVPGQHQPYRAVPSTWQDRLQGTSTHLSVPMSGQDVVVLTGCFVACCCCGF